MSVVIHTNLCWLQQQCRVQFDEELATLRGDHETALTAAQQDQKRIQDEIETLKSTQQQELQSLKTQHEAHLDQVKSEEKVSHYLLKHLINPCTGTY
jgi:hypothetical protein